MFFEFYDTFAIKLDNGEKIYNSINMERKEYSKPFMFVEQFVPNRYVAGCAPDEMYRIYHFECTSTKGNYVWIETNGTYGLQSSGNWISNPASYAPGAAFDQTWASSRSHWGTFSACHQTHDVRIEVNPDGSLKEDINNYFPKGYINTRQRASGAQDCYVWTDGGTNTHVANNLNFNDFDIHNPS